jgi:hypothetical protein
VESTGVLPPAPPVGHDRAVGRLIERPSTRRWCARAPRAERAKLAVAFAACLAVGWSASARAVPLRPPPVGPGVRYFGCWGSAAQGVGETEWASGVQDAGEPTCHADKWTGYTSCIKDHANVTHITFGLGQEDWAIARLQAAADLKMGVVLTIWNYFFKSRPDDNRKLDLVDGY